MCVCVLSAMRVSMRVCECVCYVDSFTTPQEARVEIQETERHRNGDSQDFYFGTEIGQYQNLRKKVTSAITTLVHILL